MTFTLFAIKQRLAAQPQRRVFELVPGQTREKTFAELAADVDGAVVASSAPRCPTSSNAS